MQTYTLQVEFYRYVGGGSDKYYALVDCDPLVKGKWLIGNGRSNAGGFWRPEDMATARRKRQEKTRKGYEKDAISSSESRALKSAVENYLTNSGWTIDTPATAVSEHKVVVRAQPMTGSGAALTDPVRPTPSPAEVKQVDMSWAGDW